ncbi:protein canopy 4-like [Argiope bruennichi]|uniref:Protein canopy like protein n=1 Tax=Argiope bruennichi TaxID=94029 RepID=A0A8T0E2M1_ARGBR|nr:protein canopy 4-like [Argiope bruennichi]KAF8763700.1 Protein canopy like protein [Argiope bruennichi]
MKNFTGIAFWIFSLLYISHVSCGSEEDEKDGDTPEEEMYGVKYAKQCEVCKYLVIELENRLSETGKTHEVIEIGYELDPAARKKKKYAKSELRLLESLEGICERLLDYNIHKERKDSTRFAKGMSTTFKVLHDLVDKGVKVELGIPEELWDKPSAEVTNLKMQCENLLEKHEADIEDWYFNYQDVPLKEFLCVDKALQKGDTSCLDETYVPPPPEKKGDSKVGGKSKKKSKKSVKKDIKDEKNKKGETKDEL